MLPFKGVNNSYGLLSDDYINWWYKYEASPGDVECTNDADCCANGNTEFVWCDTTLRRCLSKVSEGGAVKRAFPDRACYCPPGRRPYIKPSLTCGCKWDEEDVVFGSCWLCWLLCCLNSFIGRFWVEIKYGKTAPCVCPTKLKITKKIWSSKTSNHISTLNKRRTWKK